MKITRRGFVTMSLAGIPTLMLPDQIGRNIHRQKKLRAAILEDYSEPKTNKTLGAEIMLKRVGFEVITLNPTQKISHDISVGKMVTNFENKELKAVIQQRIANPSYNFPIEPDIGQVDLIFIGSFANRSQVYHDFLRRYANQIPTFVKNGGVFIEMAQWARYSFLHPAFLPQQMNLVREPWSGTDELIMMAKDHPLISNWASVKEILEFPRQWNRPGRFFEGNRSWESIASWEGMQVLLGAGGGYRKNKTQPGRASLVEGRYGQGSYIFSSLWLDKLFDKQGNEFAKPEITKISERFFHSLYIYTLQIREKKHTKLKVTPMPPEPVIGPVLGHIDHESAYVWLRPSREGKYILKVWGKGQSRNNSVQMNKEAVPNKDYCIRWHVTNLKPDFKYYFDIEDENGRSLINQDLYFQTSSMPGNHGKTILAFGSCVDQNGRFPELWEQIEACGAEGLVLLGDTPYIDSTVSIQQRIKQRTFLLQQGPARLSKKIPFWTTWDDHDFGSNDSNGMIHNRKGTRRVFRDYRAHDGYGEDEEGVYTSFRRGDIEVFILDTRYFSKTETSFANPDKPTLIGRKQWEWLKRKLKSSNAPFKILVAGVTWDSKRTGTETDDFEAYKYEREAIIDFIGQEKITGVLLVGGDIHCTQVMKYPTEDRIGYPLYHIVTSPMHNRIIREHESMGHPSVLFARAIPNTFLKITANTLVEPGLLIAEIIDITGVCHYRLVTGGELNVSIRP